MKFLLLHCSTRGAQRDSYHITLACVKTASLWGVCQYRTEVLFISHTGSLKEILEQLLVFVFCTITSIAVWCMFQPEPSLCSLSAVTQSHTETVNMFFSHKSTWKCCCLVGRRVRHTWTNQITVIMHPEFDWPWQALLLMLLSLVVSHHDESFGLRDLPPPQDN